MRRLPGKHGPTAASEANRIATVERPIATWPLLPATAGVAPLGGRRAADPSAAAVVPHATVIVTVPMAPVSHTAPMPIRATAASGPAVARRAVAIRAIVIGTIVVRAIVIGPVVRVAADMEADPRAVIPETEVASRSRLRRVRRGPSCQHDGGGKDNSCEPHRTLHTLKLPAFTATVGRTIGAERASEP